VVESVRVQCPRCPVCVESIFLLLRERRSPAPLEANSAGASFSFARKKLQQPGVELRRFLELRDVTALLDDEEL